jgi:hypothetical protein
MDFEVCIFWVNEIVDFLIIDLTDAHFNTELYLLACGFNSIENGPYHAGNNSLKLNVLGPRTLHCVGLS